MQPRNESNHHPMMMQPRVPGMHVFRNIAPKPMMAQHHQHQQFPHFYTPSSDHQQSSNGFKVPPGIANRIQNTLQQTKQPPQPQHFGSMEVTPIYDPSQSFQKSPSRMPPVSSMVSPPMENLKNPNWQRNHYGLPDMRDNGPDESPFFAMSSFLERTAETPAPIPLECTLGPETPSPSLPSTTPPSDEGNYICYP